MSTPSVTMLPLVGREREELVLHELTDRTPERGAALLVRGEAGIGKSRLLSSASNHASARAMSLLATAGVQSETHLPFAGLHQLLRPILAEAESLPGRQRQALLAVFGMSEAEAPDQFLVALATLNLLGEHAGDPPLLLVVEDAQWLDGPTADVLSFVARRLESDPIAMLIALRDGYESPFANAGLSELRLGGLDDASASVLLYARAPDLAPEVRVRLLNEAGGNPLALVELPAALRSEQLTALSTLRQLPLTSRLERAFAGRLEELPAATRTLLLVAAADDGGNLSEVLTAASAVNRGVQGVEALTSAVSARLVDVDDVELRFRHPLVRSAIYQAASLSERQAAHAALAEVLADAPDRRAWHRAASIGGPDEEVASELESAGVRAEQRGAMEIAVAAYERSALLTKDPTRQAGRLLRAAELAIDLGRNDTVIRLLRQAEKLALSWQDLARAAWVREMSDPGPPGDPARMRSLVETAEHISVEGHVDLALKLLWAAALSGFWAGRDDVTTSMLVVSAAERMPIHEDDPRLLSILAYAASIERGADVIERVSHWAPDPNADPGAMRLLGTAAATVGAFDLSEAYDTASAEGMRQQGQLALLAQVLVVRAWAEIHVGRWDVARSDAEEASRLGRETGQVIWAAGAQVAESILAGLRGDVDGAEALAIKAERVGLTLGARAVLSVVQLARGFTALGVGRHDDAYGHLRRMFDPADPSYHPMESSWAIGNLAEAAVHSGHKLEARTVMEKLEAVAARTPSPWMHVGMRHARALLAEDDKAEELFQVALDANLTKWPFDRARALLAYGEWLRRKRRVAESRAPLRAARNAFDVLGVAAWGERAREELRASGEASQERVPMSWDRLSPQELQIARMAAEGLSNHEIGQRLFLSRRTVGSHLYRIFPKLEITSRTQLRSVLERRAATPA